MIQKLAPALTLGLLSVAVLPAPAINVVIDYTYDTNNFFDTQQKRDAMQAVADRYGSIITSSLAGVSPTSWRIGFSHPGTGASWQISTASSSGVDSLVQAGVGAANAYGFAGLNPDEYILFAGGRNLPGSVMGQGGTGTGTNFTSTFNDINGPMHRGIADNTPANTAADLPRWGGAITFDTGSNWHFDLATTASGGDVDFYSVALHELGHALGLSTSWNQWQDDGAGNYLGSDGINAYNDDNGTSLTSLTLESGTDPHWAEGGYGSYAFPGGNTVGTVPEGTLQDPLLEPILNFGGSQQRFELTNLDVGGLRDLGWEVVPEPSVAILAACGMLGLIRRRR